MVPLESLVVIGTLDEAETAAVIAADIDSAALELSDTNGRVTNLPDYAYIAGWKCAGLGTTRIALLSPSKVVYKIMRTDYSWHSDTVNNDEWNNRFRYDVEHPECRLADCTMWVTEIADVLAMEYIHDTDTDSPIKCINVAQEFTRYCRSKGLRGLADLGPQNVKFDNASNKYVIIDYAY